MNKKRRKYDTDFKREAVRLSNEPGRTIYSVEESLGIPHGTLGKWVKQYKGNDKLAFPGNGKVALTEDQKRIKELEKQLEDVTMEREILKNKL